MKNAASYRDLAARIRDFGRDRVMVSPFHTRGLCTLRAYVPRIRQMWLEDMAILWQKRFATDGTRAIKTVADTAARLDVDALVQVLRLALQGCRPG